MGEKWTEMLFMKMVSAAPASRSEEEDRELVPRRRGPGRGRVPSSDQNLIIRLKPNLSRESAAGELAASLASGYFLSTRVSGDVLATRAQLIRP